MSAEGLPGKYGFEVAGFILENMNILKYNALEKPLVYLPDNSERMRALEGTLGKLNLSEYQRFFREKTEENVC
jgi:hypothetical protein